jgi:hypothetical protein
MSRYDFAAIANSMRSLKNEFSSIGKTSALRHSRRAGRRVA